MEKERYVKIPREPNWFGGFRLEYDGKYITLYGKDKNYPVQNYFFLEQLEVEYEEMVLVPVVEEVRNASPSIYWVDDKEITINLFND